MRHVPASLVLVVLTFGGEARADSSRACFNAALAANGGCMRMAQSTERDKPEAARGAVCDEALSRAAETCGLDEIDQQRIASMIRIAERRRKAVAPAERAQLKVDLAGMQPAALESMSDADVADLGDVARGKVARLRELAEPMDDANVGALLASIDAMLAAEQGCRATPKCMVDRAARKAEEKFFADVVAPMCDADQRREAATAEMVRERSNPSGYVDKSIMYGAGETILRSQDTIHALGPAYAKVRKHAFRGWRSECSAPDGGS